MATAITTADLTTKSLTGTGVFDELMASVNVHLQNEYAAQRIRGPEYATVYLGAMQTVMQQSIAFLLAKEKAEKDTALVEEETLFVTQQKANAVINGTVLTAQKCKLDAEFDLIQDQELKVVAETALLTQKKVTEQAQTSSTAIDTASVIGKQISLYAAQTDGFTRDAEQKAAKIMVDTWNVRRTTDETTDADSTNKLDNTNIGQVITKLKAGIGT